MSAKGKGNLTMAYELAGPPKTTRVTRKLAEEFRDMTPAPHDRPVGKIRLAVYRKAVSLGLFRPVQWGSALCLADGVTYRVNGKHTSIVFSEQEDPMPELYVTLEHYRCDTIEDVARLYATYDGKEQTRTSSDINRMFAATDPDLSGITSKVLNLAVTGMSFQQFREQYCKVRPVERAEALLVNREFVCWLDGILAGGDSWHLKRGPVVGAMFGSWLKSRKAATQFWGMVRDNEGDEQCRKLCVYLNRSHISISSGVNKPARDRTTFGSMFDNCVSGWSAWRKGFKYQPSNRRMKSAPAFA